MLAIVPLILIIASLGAILVIASRHLKKVASLDISEIPEERDAVLKTSLLEIRLLRKLDKVFKLLGNIIQPGKNFAGGWFEKGLSRIRKLERTYRFASGLPDSSRKSQGKARDLLEEAEIAKSEHNMRQAESRYLSAIKINPESVDAYKGLGDVYMSMGESGQAQETFEYMVKHWPQEDSGFASLAVIEEEKGNLEEAKDHFLHALSINNEVVEHHIDLSELYLRLNDKEKALSSLQKAQALEPNNPKILDQLLIVSVLLKNRNLAEEVLIKIKKVNPDHGKLKELEKKVKALK